MNSWLDQKEYPFNSNYFNVNGHQMHYIDEGQGETILFIHGTPSWSFDFRNVIKSLSKNYRCIAIDHVGFGLSDKPEFYDYSTQNHSWTLEKFVLELGLKNITLVLHDFGGPIGLDFAIRNSQLIKRITVLNSWLWSSEGDPKYLKLKRILKSPLLPFLYKYLNFSAKYILPSSFGDSKLSTKMKAQFTRPFENRKQRNGTLAFAHSLLNDQEWFEQLWNQRSAITHLPFLFVWGMKDPVLSNIYLEKFKEGFPNSMTVEIETAGHFPQEEQPMQVAEAIKLFFSRIVRHKTGSNIIVTFDSLLEFKIVLSVKRISFMLFKQKHLEGIKAGTVTLAFRKWKSTQLKRGSLLKTDVGIVEITDIAIINEPHINEIDAQKAGFINLESLMKSIYSAEIGKIYKIHVRFLKETQAKKIKEKISLSQSEIDSYKAKLLQMDKYARNGFWTKDILTSIKDNPKLSATQLSLKTGKTKEWLTQSIRKLKNIGLTVSLDPGYDLTPTGKLLMEHL